MKTNLIFILNPAPLLPALIVITILCFSVLAQSNENNEQGKLLPPVQEEFEQVDAVASPWKIGICPKLYYTGDCHTVSYKEFDTRNQTSLYNADGSLWFTYVNHWENANFYKKDKTKDILPVLTWGDLQSNTIFQIIGESKHWYEVEINAKTKATKFILKSESNWEKKSWEYWLARVGWFYLISNDEAEIYDKPNGKIIERIADRDDRKFRFFGKTDGDWVYIQDKNGKNCDVPQSKYYYCEPVWIRWRDDGKILIRSQSLSFTFSEIN